MCEEAGSIRAYYRNVVHICNACHVATNHEYIRIAVPGEGKSRWDQTFEPSKVDW